MPHTWNVTLTRLLLCNSGRINTNTGGTWWLWQDKVGGMESVLTWATPREGTNMIMCHWTNCTLIMGQRYKELDCQHWKLILYWERFRRSWGWLQMEWNWLSWGQSPAAHSLRERSNCFCIRYSNSNCNIWWEPKIGWEFLSYHKFSKLGDEKLYNDLSNKVLMCFEDNEEQPIIYLKIIPKSV